VHLAVLAKLAAVRRDQQRAIEAPPIIGPFGIADVESNPKLPRALEQRPGVRTRHAGFEPGVELLGGHEQPAREKGREGKLRKHHEPCPLPGGTLKQCDHAPKRTAAVVGALGRAHLRAGNADHSFHADCPDTYICGPTRSAAAAVTSANAPARRSLPLRRRDTTKKSPSREPGRTQEHGLEQNARGFAPSPEGMTLAAS